MALSAKKGWEMPENLMTQAKMDNAVLEKAYTKVGAERRVVKTSADVSLSAGDLQRTLEGLKASGDANGAWYGGLSKSIYSSPRKE
jgi:hypothetical protein